MRHSCVLNVGAWQLELGEKHEEQDDVDRDCEEVDKLGAGAKTVKDVIACNNFNKILHVSLNNVAIVWNQRK